MTSKPVSATARAPVRLPPIPGEREARTTYPRFEMEISRMVAGRLVFDRPEGMERALSQGFLLVRIPEGFAVAEGDLFARHFFEDAQGDDLDRYRGFRHREVPGMYQGYFDREHDQWENFYIEMANWDSFLPQPVTKLGHQMTDLGIGILRSVLAHLELPESDWAKVTSGLTDKNGHQMLAFNHYRSGKATRGTKFHRDSGWVTVVRSLEPGLLGLVEGELYSIDPVPGYFIVNFGSSIEVLTGHLSHPIRANIHGVARTERRPDQADRVSYVIFLDSALDGSIYRYEGGRPRAIQSVAEFALQEVSRTYDDDDIHL